VLIEHDTVICVNGLTGVKLRNLDAHDWGYLITIQGGSYSGVGWHQMSLKNMVFLQILAFNYQRYGVWLPQK
jgi:hypothetical protein